MHTDEHDGYTKSEPSAKTQLEGKLGDVDKLVILLAELKKMIPPPLAPSPSPGPMAGPPSPGLSPVPTMPMGSSPGAPPPPMGGPPMMPPPPMAGLMQAPNLEMQNQLTAARGLV